MDFANLMELKNASGILSVVKISTMPESKTDNEFRLKYFKFKILVTLVYFFETPNKFDSYTGLREQQKSTINY